MAFLTPRSYLSYVAHELERVAVPSGPERRIGALAHAEQTMRVVRRDFLTVRRQLDAGEISLERATGRLTELALELTSFLYSAGAEVPAWRHWSGVTALGDLLIESFLKAAQYAVLAGEWQLLQSLPPTPIESKQFADRVLWKLVGGRPEPELPPAMDDEDRAWLTLASSIPARDHTRTASALIDLAEYWIGESDDDDWRHFHPRSYPDFETPVCAAAALARHNGFRSNDLLEHVQVFLEPGLAEPEPDPLVPREFIWGAPAAAANGHVRRE